MPRKLGALNLNLTLGQAVKQQEDRLLRRVDRQLLCYGPRRALEEICQVTVLRPRGRHSLASQFTEYKSVIEGIVARKNTEVGEEP